MKREREEEKKVSAHTQTYTHRHTHTQTHTHRHAVPIQGRFAYGSFEFKFVAICSMPEERQDWVASVSSL